MVHHCFTQMDRPSNPKATKARREPHDATRAHQCALSLGQGWFFSSESDLVVRFMLILSMLMNNNSNTIINSINAIIHNHSNKKNKKQQYEHIIIYKGHIIYMCLCMCIYIYTRLHTYVALYSYCINCIHIVIQKLHLNWVYINYINISEHDLCTYMYAWKAEWPRCWPIRWDAHFKAPFLCCWISGNSPIFKDQVPSGWVNCQARLLTQRKSMGAGSTTGQLRLHTFMFLLARTDENRRACLAQVKATMNSTKILTFLCLASLNWTFESTNSAHGNKFVYRLERDYVGMVPKLPKKQPYGKPRSNYHRCHRF